MTNIIESYTLQDYYREIREYLNDIDFKPSEMKKAVLSALDAKIGTWVIYKKDETDGIHPDHYYCGQCGQQLLYSNYIRDSVVKHVFHYRNCPSCGYFIDYGDVRKEENKKE